MRQQELFYDSIYDAISSDIQSLGGFKKVAARLFPNKSLDTAYAHLKNCCRDDKQEKLSPEEVMTIIAWAREEGSYATINYQCDNGLLTRPDPIEPDDQEAILKRDFIDAVKVLDKIQKRQEALAERRMRAVS